MEEGAMFRKASLGIFLISGFLIITLRSGDTRQLKKRYHPDTYACPVNANLFPEEVKESNTFKYVFKSGAVVNRIGLSLQGEKNEEVEIQFNWIPEDTQVWRPVSCLIVVHCDGSPNCFFLGYHFNIPENVEAQEIRLTLLSNAQITSVAFSSLPSEKPMVLCPMPELEAEIQKAYLACVENPEDINNAYDFVVLLKKAMPEYDCRRSFDSKPVPAWWLADDRNVWKWFELLSEMEFVEAREFFNSSTFTTTLDGAIAEWYHDFMRQDVSWDKVFEAAQGYFSSPSSETALSLYSTLPLVQVFSRRRKGTFWNTYEYIYNNLDILERHVLSGDRNAAELAVQLFTIAEGLFPQQLKMMLGDFIQVNPRAFLEVVSPRKITFITVDPDLWLLEGNILFDGKLIHEYEEKGMPDKVKQELELRLKALKTVSEVSDSELIRLRDSCIKALEDRIAKFIPGQLGCGFDWFHRHARCRLDIRRKRDLSSPTMGLAENGARTIIRDQPAAAMGNEIPIALRRE